MRSEGFEPPTTRFEVWDSIQLSYERLISWALEYISNSHSFHAKDVHMKPSDSTLSAWFTDARFGMFIHWGLYAIPARGEWARGSEQIPDEAYRTFAGEFAPDRFDPVAWAAIAKKAGMKYVVMTAKHHDGFCLFDSKFTDFKATNTPAKRDLVREYVEAFRAAGIKVGLYYSLLDWNHPDYPIDRLHPLRSDEAAKAQPREFSRYQDYLHNQVREILTNYGTIDLLWFDFSYDKLSDEAWRATELVKMIRSLQPNILLNNRLVAGHANVSHAGELGDITTPEQLIPEEGVRKPDGSLAVWEACMTLNNSWGYNRHDHSYKSATQVIRMLAECVSKGGNLLLNVGPTARGEIPDDSIRILDEVGRWLQRNGDSIYGCTIAPFPKPEWGRYTFNVAAKKVFAHMLERQMAPFNLPNMKGKVTRPRWLEDGSEIKINQPWNIAESAPHLCLDVSGWQLPNPHDTVISLNLV